MEHSKTNGTVADEETPLLATAGEQQLDIMDDDDDDAVPKRSWRRQASQLWSQYNSLLEKPRYALLVKSVTGLIILGLGDFFGQVVEFVRGTSTTSFAVDWLRVARFGAFGLLGAPWSHYYFGALDAWLPPTPKPWTRTTLVKVFIDQFIQAPLLLALMISSLSVMKGTGMSGLRSDMNDNYVKSLVANWELWIPCSLINLAFVKPTLRVLYVNVVFFVWTIILSVMINSSS